jgi:hypothetical protein
MPSLRPAYKLPPRHRLPNDPARSRPSPAGPPILAVVSAVSLIIARRQLYLLLRLRDRRREAT